MKTSQIETKPRYLLLSPTSLTGVFFRGCLKVFRFIKDFKCIETQQISISLISKSKLFALTVF